MIVKAGLLTTVFSHVLNAIEPEYRKNIFLMFAQRYYEKQGSKSKTILPYLSIVEKTDKMLRLKKDSETIIPFREWEKIVDEIKKGGFIDLTVTSLGFIIENTSLKKTIEDSIGRKIAPTKFVLLFHNNPKSAKEDYIKRDLLDVMKAHVDKLGFNYATIELTGIYTLQDWRSGRKENFLTSEKINLEKDTLREIICSLFKQSILISGKETNIRFIKWYEMGSGRMLKLAGYEKV